MKTFVIVGQQRTGTTMLVRTLNGHNQVRCLGELFIDRYPNQISGSYAAYLRGSPWRRLGGRLMSAGLVKRFLDEISTAPRSLFSSDEKQRNCKAIGFKLMYGQAKQQPAALPWLKANGTAAIHLVRTNVLAVLVSREVNRITQVPHTTHAIATPAVKLEVARLLETLEKIEAINQNWPRLVDTGRYIRVDYEDLVEHRAREIGRILEFLGVESCRSLESTLVKVNQADLRMAIANYDEVAERLKGTVFARCLQH
jgi:LPS sulfotransferase NodH